MTAKLPLAELPFYLAACWYLTMTFGITGAAAAWTGRALLDCAALLWLARSSLPEERERRAGLAIVVPGMAAAWTFGLVPLPTPLKLLYVAVVIVLSAVVSWKILLSESERNFFLATVSGLPFLSKVGAGRNR